MSKKRRIFLWSMALSLPLQYLAMLAVSLMYGPSVGGAYDRPGAHFACPNFHSSMQPCGLGEMLLSNLVAVLVLDVATLGIAFAVAAAVAALIVLGWQRVKEKLDARDRRRWL